MDMPEISRILFLHNEEPCVKENTNVVAPVFDRGPRGTAVYMELLDRVQRGDVALGDRLVDTAIAAEMGVSRMPVREALLRLVHEGYLVGTTRGFMLPELSDQDIAEIFEIRKLLEPRAAASAAYSLDSQAIDELESAYRLACDSLEQSDADGLMQANTRFRQAWLNAVPNARLAATIGRFVDHVQAVRVGTLHDRETQMVVVALLTDLLEGFRLRNSVAVYDAMARFVDVAQGRFFSLMERVRSDFPDQDIA